MPTKPQSKTKSGEYHVDSSAATPNFGELRDRRGAYVRFDTPKLRGVSSDIEEGNPCDSFWLSADSFSRGSRHATPLAKLARRSARDILKAPGECSARLVSKGQRYFFNAQVWPGYEQVLRLLQ